MSTSGNATDPGDSSEPAKNENISLSNQSVNAEATDKGNENRDNEDEIKYVKPQVISPKTAKQMMDEADSYVLLDVRTLDEFIAEHIEGAMLLPDYEIDERANDKLPDKAVLLFVYCRSGVRSDRAAHALARLGYSNVYDFGGILSWPYDTVTSKSDEDGG